MFWLAARVRGKFGAVPDLHLEGADLRGAHLEGKVYAPDDLDLARVRQVVSNFPAALPPADLRGAFFDSATSLNGAVLAATERGAVRVADVRWGGVNLAVVADWAPFTEHNLRLGDEQAAWTWRPEPFTETAEQQKQPQRARRQARTAHDQEQARERRVRFQAAVRANRQVATALRGQGMKEGRGGDFHYEDWLRDVLDEFKQGAR